MKNLKIGALLLLVVLIMASCTTASFSGLQMSKEMPSFEVVGDFNETIWVSEFLGTPGGANLFNISAGSMDGPVYDAIQRQITKKAGDAAIDISIREEAGLVEMLITGITAGIYSPCTVKVSGTVIKYVN